MLESIRKNKIIAAVAAFMDRKYFPFIMGAIIAILHIAGLNEVGFVFVGVVLCFINLFSSDTRPAVPVVFTAVLVVSTRSDKMQASVEYFTRPSVIAVLVVAMSLIIVSALLRLYYDKSVLGCFKVRRLSYGFAAFSAALLLGGLGSKFFAVDSWELAVTMILTGLILYMYFSGTLKRRDDDLEYLAYCCMTAAAVIIVELAALYIRVYEPGMPLDSYFKSKLVIGWGISNPIGELLAFMLAPVFLLVYKKNHGWLYYIFAIAIMGAIFFSLSRNALLFGSSVFVAMTAVCIVKSRKNRLGVSISAGVVLVAFIVAAAIGHDGEVENNLFAFIERMGMNDNGRFRLWKQYFGFFREYPVFGAGFAACGTLGSATMRLAHDTIFQLLGSCGVVGLAAHVYHRYQTVTLFVKKPNIYRTIFGVALLAYIGMGLLDPIYFFANFTIYYTVILVFAEKDLEHSLAADEAREKTETSEISENSAVVPEQAEVK